MLRGIKTNYFFFKAYSQVKKGDIDRSIEYFNRVIAADQTFSGAYLHKALALSKLKKYEEGIDEINKAISLEPHNPAFPLFLGIIQHDTKNYYDT